MIVYGTTKPGKYRNADREPPVGNAARVAALAARIQQARAAEQEAQGRLIAAINRKKLVLGKWVPDPLPLSKLLNLSVILKDASANLDRLLRIPTRRYPRKGERL